MSANTIIDQHPLRNAMAVVCNDGSATILNITYGKDAQGTRIEGNGTLPHPLRAVLDDNVAKGIARWVYCRERGIFPVRTQHNDRWVMLNDDHRAFIGHSPEEAIDLAMEAET